MQIDKDLFYESLYKKLNPRSGEFQPIDNTNETGCKETPCSYFFSS